MESKCRRETAKINKQRSKREKGQTDRETGEERPAVRKTKRVR